jgi:FADH2 O2-dependent halogenase
MPSEPQRLETDVVILGSGLAGSITALCLVRQGLRVMILEKGTHPRFALGESTTTPSSLWLKVIAERFNAPEIHNIATAEGIRRHVAPTSGVKSNFGFLYHERGAERMARSWQAVIAQADCSDSDAGPPPSSEMHYFRQDIDEYLWSTALGAGAVGRSGCTVTGVCFREEGATVETASGESIHCAFVIDASGSRSVVADTLGLREDPPRMRTNSRAMFTHMVGVTPFEDVDREAPPVVPWSQGTLHHFFDGGWVWVIPFDNQAGSQNDLCSVGLCYDNRRFPRDPEVVPEEAWSRFLDEYPAIRRQFAEAETVRPWAATDRLQYSSSRCVGDRFWLTAHAAGSVDALYSMGNINTFQSIATGVRLVLEAFEHDTFSEQHFQPLQRLTDNLLRFQDRIVYGSYVGSRSPALLELWFTLWGMTDGARIREVLKPIVRYARTDRLDDLAAYDERPEEVLTGFGQMTEVMGADEALDLLDACCDIMLELEEGEVPVDEAVERLRTAMDSDDRFEMYVDVITNGLGRAPWALEPLRRHGVKALTSAFLTLQETMTLGLEPEHGDDAGEVSRSSEQELQAIRQGSPEEARRGGAATTELVQPDGDIRAALDALGVPDRPLSAFEREHLDDLGYVVLEDVLSPGEVDGLCEYLDALYQSEGILAGAVDPTPYQKRLRIPRGRWFTRLARRLYLMVFATVRGVARGVFDRWPELARPYVRCHPTLGPPPWQWLAELREMVATEARQEARGVRKLADLVNKGAIFDGIHTHPRVLAGVTHLLGTKFKLSSLNFREPEQGAGLQPLHVDWLHGVSPTESYACNALWFLDDADGDNGTTRLVPGSHRSMASPLEVLDSATAPHPDEVLVSMRRGSVLLLNSHVWHGGTTNTDGRRRRILQAYYAHRAAEPQTTQRVYFLPETRERVSAAARAVLDVR